MNGSVLTATASTLPAPARALLPAARSRLRDAAVVAAIWTVVALLSAGFGALNRIYSDQPPEWARLLTLNLLAFELCIPATLIFVWAVRRWPLGAGRWRYALIYLAAIPVLVVCKYAIYLPIRVWMFPMPLAQIKGHLIESFFYEGIMLTLVVGVVHAVEFQRSVREGQLRASLLENHLTRARLEILRAELQPHFLFNALHSISTLMHRNVEAADEMLAQLGDLLRLSLERKSVQQAPLREELSVLEPYLNILRIRFDVVEDPLERANLKDGSPEGCLSPARPGLVPMESLDAAGDQGKLHRRLRWQAPGRPLWREEAGSDAGHSDPAGRLAQASPSRHLTGPR